MRKNKIILIGLIYALSIAIFSPVAVGDKNSEAIEKAKAAKEKLVSAKTNQKVKYPPYPNVHLKTNLGDIYLVLDGMKAPITTTNFLDYVTAGHYDNTIFHRVIPGFVAQGGGYDTDFVQREYKEPIVNESGNGLSNLTGTIAMARVNEPHTATSQFYINLVDNTKLDPNPKRWGYAVFGEVQYGMNMLQKFSKQPTGAGGSFKKDVPIKALIIEEARLMKASETIPIEPIEFDDEAEDEVEEALESETEVQDES